MALMVDWHLGMVETEAGQPRPLGPADAATLTRAWLVPLAAARLDARRAAGGLRLRRRGRQARARLQPDARRPRPRGRGRRGVHRGGTARIRSPRRSRARDGGWIEAVRVAAGDHAHARQLLRPCAAPGRAVSPGRAGDDAAARAGVLAASLGHRRTADVLVSPGALAGVARGRRGSAHRWNERRSVRPALLALAAGAVRAVSEARMPCFVSTVTATLNLLFLRPLRFTRATKRPPFLRTLTLLPEILTVALRMRPALRRAQAVAVRGLADALDLVDGRPSAARSGWWSRYPESSSHRPRPAACRRTAGRR